MMVKVGQVVHRAPWQRLSNWNGQKNHLGSGFMVQVIYRDSAFTSFQEMPWNCSSHEGSKELEECFAFYCLPDTGH